jgi:hypothetical protein
MAKAMDSCAVKQLPWSASHSTGSGDRRAQKRRSIASRMRSRTAIPLIPRRLTVQTRTSRSWVSIANATRTASPFQHGISNTSAAQRRFEAGVPTSPSCGRCRPRPVWGASSSPPGP